MKILLCSLEGDGAWFVWLMRHNGHSVDWAVTEAKDEDTFAGIIPPPKKSPKAASYDLIVFDSTDMGEAADAALAQGVPIIGDSVFADRLEDDRLFGIEMMEQAGIRVPTWEAFDNPSKAIDWLKKTHKRCVLKPFGDMPKELTYVAKNEADMIHFIEKVLPGSKVKQFLLQEFITGTEISTEAYWTGTQWTAYNHDLEEKKFMAGGVGPNTGCAGSLIWMPPRPTPLFQQGLSKISPLLEHANFRGPIDLNAIVTDGTVYGLEWTPRFGYEGTCNLTRLLPMEFGEFLHAVATGNDAALTHMEAKHRFAATVRLSVPPYPNNVDKAPRIAAHDPIEGLSVDDLETFFAFNIELDSDGHLLAVKEGCIGSPIGCSDSVQGAFDEVYTAINRLEIPDLQYRTDIDKCVAKRYAKLKEQGWLKPIG